MISIPFENIKMKFHHNYEKKINLQKYQKLLHKMTIEVLSNDFIGLSVTSDGGEGTTGFKFLFSGDSFIYFPMNANENKIVGTNYYMKMNKMEKYFIIEWLKKFVEIFPETFSLEYIGDPESEYNQYYEKIFFDRNHMF